MLLRGVYLGVLQTHTGPCLVDQVDGLVREEAVAAFQDIDEEPRRGKGRSSTVDIGVRK